MALKQTEKMRTIRITEQQLKEAENFSFITSDNDTPHCDGQSNISVGGKLNDDENAKPIDTDDVADTIFPQARVKYYDRHHGISRTGRMFGDSYVEESVDLDGDKDNNGVDDFFEKPELDNKEGNDIVQIPQGVQRKVDLLLSDAKRLSPKQQAVVLDKIIEAFDLSSLPPSYLKNLRLDVQ